MKSTLKEANRELRAGRWDRALELYQEFIIDYPEFKRHVKANIVLSLKKSNKCFAEIVDKPISTVLFLLATKLQSGFGYQLQLYIQEMLISGVPCLVAVPDSLYEKNYRFFPWIPDLPQPELVSFSTLLRHPNFWLATGFTGSIVIHACSADESVYQVVQKIRVSASVSVVLQLNAVDMQPNRRFLFTHVDGLIASVSSGQAIRTPMISSRYHQIHTLVDERLFYPRPQNNNLRDELGVPSDCCLIVCPSSVFSDSPKLLMKLLDALKHLKEIGCPSQLIITGRAALIPSIALPDGALVNQLGWVDRIKIPEVLAAADILLYPEGKDLPDGSSTPATLAEYFAMGRPIVMSRSILNGVHLKHQYHAWLLESGSTEKIIEAFKAILTDKILAQKLSLESVVFFREHLSQSLSSGLLPFYETVVRASMENTK